VPEDKKSSVFRDFAITAPAGAGFSYAYSQMSNKGLFSPPSSPATPSFMRDTRKVGLQPSGIDLSFIRSHAKAFGTKHGAEIARTAWIEAVRSTDPFASDVLSFAGDIRKAESSKVYSSIEQTLQRNNSLFMARIHSKFKSNVRAMQKHREITGKIPKFKAVEGLTFTPATNKAISELPRELQAFHKSFIKDTGIVGTGTRYYTRAGWEGYGTYVMSYMKGKQAFDITVPISRGGTLIEGLTQSARRIAQDVGVFDPRSGDITRMSRTAFHLRDIQKSILPQIQSGVLSSSWDIERALGAAYKRNIYSLEAVPNLPEDMLSESWKSYARIKGGAGIDVFTEGKTGFERLTEEQRKQVMGKRDIYPFPGPKNLAQGRVSSYNAAEWFMTPQDVDWAGQPRQVLRQWRASDAALAEMITSGSSKWSIFETSTWQKEFGKNAAPWVPTVYVDPKMHGVVLQQLGIKDGESLIAESLKKQLEVVGQPYPIHLGSVTEGVAERIKSGAKGLSAFSVGETLGITPEGKTVSYEKGMRLLGLEKFQTTGRGQEMALMIEQTLPSEMAAKRFGGIKAVEKLVSKRRLAWGIEQLTKGLSPEERRQFTSLRGEVRIATSDTLKYQHRINTQKITGLWEMMNRRNAKDAYKRGSNAAAFLKNPVEYMRAFRGAYSSPSGFMKGLEQFAIKEGRLTEGAFWSIFGGEISGLSFGISQGIFDDPMRLTGAGALGSVEPRMFDILKAGQYGALGADIADDLARRMALSSPEKLATYEALTKTLASSIGKVSPGKGAAMWDVVSKGYQREAFQQFIESGGGYLDVGAGQKPLFVPGGDILTPYRTAAGKVIPGDLAMEYHNLAKGMAKMHIGAKRVDLAEAGKMVDGFIGNILKQQAPFGSGAGAIGRLKGLKGSMYFRGVSEIGGYRPPNVRTVGIPQMYGEKMFEDLASLGYKGAELEELQAMNKRFLAGETVAGGIWRNPLAGPYSFQPINIQMIKGITEPVVAMPSELVDIGVGGTKRQIELGPMVGMGMDLDADIASVSLVSPDLEKKMRQGFTQADNEFTRAQTEHMVRAQIIKTKAAGGAEALTMAESKLAAAMKLSTGQEWIGRLSNQMSIAKQASYQRLGGQRAANIAFTLGWLEESIIKSKHLGGQQVLSGEMSALLATAESSFKAKDPVRLESVIRGMLAQSDEASRALLSQDVRITEGISRIREITGTKSMREVLPAVNVRDVARDTMNAMEWAESTGIEEMSRMAAGKRSPSPGSLSKYLSYTGSIAKSAGGTISNVVKAGMAAKNFTASLGMGLLEHKKAIGLGLTASLAIGAALSTPKDLVGSGAELVPDAKTQAQFNKAAGRMRAEDIHPPEAPLGEPTVPPMLNIPTARILPGAESRNINISARRSSDLNTEDMINNFRKRMRSDRMNINIRDNTSTLNRYNITDKILR
jgi:hypothetical protein